MTNRQAATLLTAFVVLYLAAFVLLAPRFDQLDFSSDADWLAAVAVGLVVASPALLAIWAVHSRQRAAVRLPLSCWLMAMFYLAALYGEVRYFGRGNADVVLFSAVAWLTASTALVVALRLLRAVRGWLLERLAPETPSSTAGQPAGSKRLRQFTIRTLLGWTAAAAALCAAARWPAPYIDTDELSAQIVQVDLIEGSVVGLILALASLPAVAAVWFVLADGRRTILRVVLIAITASGIAAGIAAFRHLLDVQEPGFVTLAVGLEAGVSGAGLLTALLVRACSYRLVRPTKGLGASAGVAVRPRQFTLAGASLAAASIVLVCCAPARFELWRQADEQERWAALGWEAGFDAEGRITSLVHVANEDLSGSEFDLGGLSDLESLEFSNSLLSDTQLIQYTLHGRAPERLTSLNLSDTRIGDAGLAHLARFPNLTHLSLTQTNITNAGIAHLAALKHLTDLELAATDVSDEAIESLSRLEHLESLHLNLTAVSESGVRRLRQALPKATVWYGASDASLKNALTSTVRTTRARGAGVAIGVAIMAKQPKRLHARGRACVSAPSQPATSPSAGVTDAGVAFLDGQTELEELDLRDSDVTDAGLGSLTKLAKLRRLDLRGAQVTEDGCRKLANALTNCEILR